MKICNELVIKTPLGIDLIVQANAEGIEVIATDFGGVRLPAPPGTIITTEQLEAAADMGEPPESICGGEVTSALGSDGKLYWIELPHPGNNSGAGCIH